MNIENSKKSILSILLCMLIVFGTLFASVTVKSSSSKGNITIHYKGDYSNPNIYYWNSLPENIEVNWPGDAMEEDSNGWYSYSFKGVTKINFLFNENGKQTDDLTAESGEWWYKDGKLLKENPESTGDSDNDDKDNEDNKPEVIPSDRTDFREETIYFVMTTRFYDGYLDNNVHCWDDKQAKNPDDDPAWRGDFQGLIDKLDYIKALGFSAIWITPVVENASGYDYHGYHAINFKKVDPRYESPKATYQDLINAVHEKGMKIIQDIVVNHSGNFGEENIFPLFKKTDTNLDDVDKCMVKDDPNGLLPSDYDSLQPSVQYGKRIDAMKNDNTDTENIYHHEKSLQWESFLEQTGQIAGDCVDLNTENPVVAKYLRDAYLGYINMGVDGFRVDTVKHISRLTWNKEFLPQFMEAGGDNFYIFGEVCTRDRSVWNRNIPALSAPFFTWKERKEYAWGDTDTNMASIKQAYNDNQQCNDEPTSDNAFLNGNEYHKPDRTKFSGMNVIDFPMHWNFKNASDAFNVAKDGDKYYNDATWNVTYVDSHDYAPDQAPENQRFNADEDTWAENLNLMFTFRGIPCLYYGSEIQFQKGMPIDVGPNAPLSQTGRAYYGDYIEGDITATDFGEYTASGKVAETLNHPLAQHVIRLNKIRRAIPALQKGQYSTEGVSGSGMAFKRGYKDGNVNSFVCVSITGGATFTGVPAGKYVDAITGDTINSDGTLTIPETGKGNMRVYVLNGSGQIGESGKYLK